jgi:hypothetical protein
VPFAAMRLDAIGTTWTSGDVRLGIASCARAAVAAAPKSANAKTRHFIASSCADADRLPRLNGWGTSPVSQGPSPKCRLVNYNPTAKADLKGTWSGKGKSIVFGTNPHHPGSQTVTDPPRVRDIEPTYTVEGQEGRLVWGRSASTAADTKEPFAWAIASDNRTIVGADMDDYFRITLISPDRIEKCYTHNATSPSRSIVATCHTMDRVKR